MPCAQQNKGWVPTKMPGGQKYVICLQMIRWLLTGMPTGMPGGQQNATYPPKEMPGVHQHSR